MNRAFASSIPWRKQLVHCRLPISRINAHNRVEELVSGVRAPLSLRIYGEDMAVVDRLSAEIKPVLEGVPGASDLSLDVNRVSRRSPTSRRDSSGQRSQCLVITSRAELSWPMRRNKPSYGHFRTSYCLTVRRSIRALRSESESERKYASLYLNQN
jgi:hypothetical protein